MPDLYQLNSVKQSYAGRTVLDVERLSVMAGEILAIVGPSGAGKSTLLRLLNFLESPTAGTILFEGQPVPPRPPLALVRRVTSVFQRPLLLNRPVRDNVAYGLLLRGETADGRVNEALERVGLTGLAGEAAHKLSGGEMQRVALARALALRYCAACRRDAGGEGAAFVAGDRRRSGNAFHREGDRSNARAALRPV
ncbi:MAG: ATP-binding cassette domain-containing protein [Chloroflexota bacterium]